MTSRAAFLQTLPPPELLKKRLRTFAMYDAIAAPEARSFEFHPKWGPGSTSMGAFKDGEGNFFFAWFPRHGAVIRGFDHDSPMSPFRRDPPARWPGLFDGLPASFHEVLEEPAFAQDEVTFAFWATADDGPWRAGRVKPAKGKDADGAERLLGCFARNFEGWRHAYYETPRSDALGVLWWHKPLTREVVLALNPDADLEAVRREAKFLGWKASGLEGRAPRSSSPAPALKASPKPKRRGAQPAAHSFGEAEFVVRCEPTRVRLLIQGTTVVAEAGVDVYEELFDLVKARLMLARRTRK